MRWDDTLTGLFEDLEQQAEGLRLAERDAELLDRSRSEYAEVDLASRLYASVGGPVTLTVAGVGVVAGVLVRVGAGWCLVEAPGSPAQEWVVLLPAVTRATGLSERAVSETARPAVAHLPVRSVMRGISDARSEVTVHHVDGTHVTGSLGRAGADFVELVTSSDEPRHRRKAQVQLVPCATLAALRRR